jgi:hypothetical protein
VARNRGRNHNPVDHKKRTALRIVMASLVHWIEGDCYVVEDRSDAALHSALNDLG